MGSPTPSSLEAWFHARRLFGDPPAFVEANLLRADGKAPTGSDSEAFDDLLRMHVDPVDDLRGACRLFALPTTWNPEQAG